MSDGLQRLSMNAMLNVEWDLLLMSLVIFVPSFAALLLLFVPSGKEEWMRWVSLFGTAVTFALSAWMFIDYYYDVPNLYMGESAKGTLNDRAQRADDYRAKSQPEALSGHDWLARRSWISSFNIDYYLGVDGISMPLVLL